MPRRLRRLGAARAAGRAALLRRNPTRNADEGYNYHARRQEQGKRQGYAWASLNVISGQQLDLSEKAFKTLSEKKALVLKIYQDLQKDYMANKKFGEAHVATITYGAELKKILPQLSTPPTAMSVKKIYDLCSCVGQMYDEQPDLTQVKAKLTSTQGERTWSAFAKDMDAKFSKKKKFGDIALIQMYPQKAYGSVSAAIACVTQPPADFVISRAMIVGISMKKGNVDTGHAVAIRWDPRNIFVLLDPNYGMFVYDTLAGPNSVKAALSYLFETAYPEEAGLKVLDTMDYEIYANREGLG